MANGRSKWRRSKRGLYWGLFLLLFVLSGAVYLFGFSPGGIVRGVKFLIASTILPDQEARESPQTSPSISSSEKDGNVLLRAIEKQRQELQEKETELKELESRLAREKQEIIRERKALEAARSGGGPAFLRGLSRYSPLLILLSICLWLVLVLYIVIRRAVGGRRVVEKPASAPPGPTVKLDGNLAALRESLARMISDVEDVAGRVPDELRQGSLALRELIREADQRMGELRGLLAQVTAASKEELTRQTRQASGSAETDSELEEDKTERNELVYQLAEEGHSEEDIARRLNLGIGEVQLILNLKRSGDDAR